MDLGVDPHVFAFPRIKDRMGADPMALIEDRESSIAGCTRRTDCCHRKSDMRKRTTDGPGKSGDEERASLNAPLDGNRKHKLAGSFLNCSFRLFDTAFNLVFVDAHDVLLITNTGKRPTRPTQKSGNLFQYMTTKDAPHRGRQCCFDHERPREALEVAGNGGEWWDGWPPHFDRM